jgi:hypothetical protein
MLKAIWNDSNIRAFFAKVRDGSHYYIVDYGADYFFDSIDRFSAPDYLPNVNDVLRIRNGRTGLQEDILSFKKGLCRVQSRLSSSSIISKFLCFIFLLSF